MGKYHIFQENTEFTPKILKMGEIYTDSEMCWLEALHLFPFFIAKMLEGRGS